MVTGVGADLGGGVVEVTGVDIGLGGGAGDGAALANRGSDRRTART